MESPMPDAQDRTPVIVGIGEVTDRPEQIEAALEPAALMAEAFRRADKDAGGGWLLQLDGLDVVNSISWPYADLPTEVTRRIGHRPARLVYGPVGGETPVRFLHEAALRIWRGESDVEALVGGEAEQSAQRARRADIELP